jgi:hypothetical protein
MGVFPVSEGKGRRRAWHGVFFLLLFLSLTACSLGSPKSRNREELLRRDVRSFHWALLRQDAPVALRYVPAHERDPWDTSFTCLFQRFRLLDYRVEFVKFREKSSQASGRVRWTAHPPDSLVVREMLWKEQWTFDTERQRWSLVSSPEAIEGLPAECLPSLPEKAESAE